ncbi:MAG: 50S ribosomal protein L29 [Puniceicoccaceae bacterium]
MKPQDIRELPVHEIEKKIRDLRAELVQLRLRKSTGQVEKPHLLREIRRQIARNTTILIEKQRAKATQTV